MSRDAMEQLRCAAAAAGVDVEEMERRAGEAIPGDEFESQREEAERARKELRGIVCAECAGRVDLSDVRLLREVVGWSRPRDGGGQSHVIARRETGRILCRSCGARTLAGLDPQQTTLV